MSDADVVISALRSGFDTLAAVTGGLSDAELAAPSAAAEWDISQVLSHLGSGAEIGEATLRAALDGRPRPETDFARGVWARWDAMGRRERADGFLAANTSLTGLYESLPATVRQDLRIDLGFVPAPADVATAGRFRLNELTLHSWDVRAALDPAATLAPEAVPLLTPVAAAMLGFIGKPDALGGAESVIEVVTTGPALRLALHLGPAVSVSDDVPPEPDGTLSLPAEAWLRLLTGRLAEPYTPSSVSAAGAADLGLLRKVFPGF
ncbi:MAG TPA: maleylpyruvate isomerase family mycothiol-dependent enzyme [Trebonia sp.]|nr:maleylpyruvate isomerase family mycothiol-dependent enzyme [Trebonia sp.]